MSTIVLGCDHNQSNDAQFQGTVAKLLRKAGHSVEVLPIGPNDFASYSYGNGGKKPQGKIGVFLIADGITAIADLYQGNTGFKYAYFGVRGDLGRPKMDSWDDFRKNPIGKDWHGDCSGSIEAICNKLSGKTFPQMNEIIKKKCQIVFGSTAEEMANSVIKAMGGESLTDDTGDNIEGVDSKDQEAKGTSIKEALQRLLKHWDGEVECYIRGDKVYVHKVRDPVTYTSLLLEEGVNVLSGSISIKDVNPETINHLIVEWTDGTIELKDNVLIKRFGEKEDTVKAVRIVTTASEEMEENRQQAEDENLAERGVAGAEMQYDEEGNPTTTDGGTGEEEGTGEATDEEGETSNKKSKVQSIPIDNYDEALAFANTYWNKIRRDDGHSIDCQVMGASNWRVGEWCRVKLPSFNEDGYMYITRASHSGDADWTCSLTLQDYPPGWGVEELEDEPTTVDNNGNDEESENPYSEATIKKIIAEIKGFQYSNSCSDKKCLESSKKGDCWALSDYLYSKLEKEGISARIYQFKTEYSAKHRQVKFNNGSEWVMFPYDKSGIDHMFYTNSIPDDAKKVKGQ